MPVKFWSVNKFLVVKFFKPENSNGSKIRENIIDNDYENNETEKELNNINKIDKKIAEIKETGLSNLKTNISDKPKKQSNFFWQKWNTNEWFLFYSIVVIIISFFTFFYNYQNPQAPFWDENYHISAAQKYLDGVFFLELHPPLGKLLIALGEKIWHPNSSFDTTTFTNTDYIRQFPNDYSFIGVRFFPVILAMFSGYLFFLLLFILSKNPHLSFAFSGLFLFDNAMIVHFRGAMLDGIQMFFILASLVYFAHIYKEKLFKWHNYLILGLLIGLSVATKINAMIFTLLFLFLQWQENEENIRNFKKNTGKLIKNFFSKGLIFGAGLIFIFGLINYIHINIATNVKGDKSTEIYNDNDVSQELRNLIDKKQTLNPISAFYVSRDWYNFQNDYNKNVPKLDVTKPDENGSYPTNWLVGRKTISYRWQKYPIEKDAHFTYDPNEMENKEGSIITLEEYGKLPDDKKKDYVIAVKYLYLVANPIIWFIGLVGLILSIVLVLSKFIFGLEIKNQAVFKNILVFQALYLVYMGAVLSVERVLYMYHYFVPLVCSLILAFLVFNYIFDQDLKHPKMQKTIYSLAAVMIVLIFICFLYFAPFSYYLPLSEDEFQARNWFSFWGMKVVK